MSPGIVARLLDLRTNLVGRVAFVGLGVLVGLLLGGIHWIGILAGGAVAGVAQRTTARGVGAGVLAGVGIWLGFLALLGLDGAALPALRATPIVAVSLVITVAYGALGGLVRGLY